MDGIPVYLIYYVIRGTSAIHTSIYDLRFQAHIFVTLSSPRMEYRRIGLMFVMIMLVEAAIKLWICISLRIVAVETKIARPGLGEVISFSLLSVGKFIILPAAQREQ